MEDAATAVAPEEDEMPEAPPIAVGFLAQQEQSSAGADQTGGVDKAGSAPASPNDRPPKRTRTVD